ncbi:pyrroline-5-carboxylate reductase [Metabacillus mangrovi]|nr:pyrroline-5-carboxylate reductase [Metabacillus mangrovi]
MMDKKKIAFIGAGSMAEAMIAGIAESGTVGKRNIYAANRSNQSRLQELEENYGINGMLLDELPYSEIDAFILAMKPKDAQKALVNLKGKIKAEQAVISVIAGISSQFIEACLHDRQQVIRVMPNTSSTIGESATGVSPSPSASMENVWLAEELMASVGQVFRIKEEEMDLFTGIAGSGPAYFYYLMESIEETARANGMDIQTARKAGAQTILGAAKMILNGEEAPSELRRKVTSPNGTTAAGLDALNFNGGGYAIEQAILSAAKRSKEISEQFEESMLVK